MTDRKRVLSCTTALLIAISSVASVPSTAFAENDYRKGQEMLRHEDRTAGSAGMAAGLTCAAAASWTGIFTIGIGPALAGLGCAIIAESATRTAMRCSVNEDTRIRTGLGKGCIVVAGGFRVKF